MSDTDNGDNKSGGKTLTLRGGETGRVRQSFSHGRTKSVVVEKKRKRVFTPREGAIPGVKPAADGVAPEADVAEAAPAPAPAPEEVAAPSAEPKPRQGKRQNGRGEMLRTLSPEEHARRLKALELAKKDEGARRQREADERAQRDAELERKRVEAEDKKRADAEAEAARIAAEEEAARKAAEEEAIRARPAARAAQPKAPRPEPAAEPAAEAEAAEQPAPAERRVKPAAEKTAEVVDAQSDDRPGRGKRVATADELKRAAPARVREDGRRRSGKLTINQALSGDEGGRQKSLAAMRRRQEREKRKMLSGSAEREKVIRDVKIPDVITVQELANRMAERAADVIKSLMRQGMMATINEALDADTAELIVEEFGHRSERVSESDVENVLDGVADSQENLKPRAPVVTVMGHVDHGKTSLLDALRKTNVVSGEAGGITQHIGAYQVHTDSGVVTFLDTPGHAAFTSMRARGAQVTDIVILVVAADDSVMPQTIEAISHAKAAKVPMIVAINKIDKPSANPNRVRQELLQHEVFVEALGGDVLDVEVSAVRGDGLDKLLENIVLQAEVLELKANPDRPAEGAVIEAKLDVGRGPVATVLVQKGTLRNGDIFVVGEQWGRVRALVDDQGERVNEAGPSVPVEVLGLQGTPEAGDVLQVVESEAKAREIADYRRRKARQGSAGSGSRTTLDQLLAQAKAGEVPELPVVVKADVQGSNEAIVQALEKIGAGEVRVRVLHSGVGAITESDVTLADASGAPIIGFNVRANAPARESANQKGVEIRYYSVIYDLVDDVKKAAEGLLSPEIKETFIGYASIKQVFKITGVGKIAGCVVTDGVARRSAGVRLLRDNVVIHQGKLKTLKRFKDEVKEVNAGQECGMAFENYEDIREGDVIEIFESEEIERTLA